MSDQKEKNDREVLKKIIKTLSKIFELKDKIESFSSKLEKTNTIINAIKKIKYFDLVGQTYFSGIIEPFEDLGDVINELNDFLGEVNNFLEYLEPLRDFVEQQEDVFEIREKLNDYKMLDYLFEDYDLIFRLHTKINENDRTTALVILREIEHFKNNIPSDDINRMKDELRKFVDITDSLIEIISTPEKNSPNELLMELIEEVLEENPISGHAAANVYSVFPKTNTFHSNTSYLSSSYTEQYFEGLIDTIKYQIVAKTGEGKSGEAYKAAEKAAEAAARVFMKAITKKIFELFDISKIAKKMVNEVAKRLLEKLSGLEQDITAYLAKLEDLPDIEKLKERKSMLLKYIEFFSGEQIHLDVLQHELDLNSEFKPGDYVENLTEHSRGITISKMEFLGKEVIDGIDCYKIKTIMDGYLSMLGVSSTEPTKQIIIQWLDDKFLVHKYIGIVNVDKKVDFEVFDYNTNKKVTHTLDPGEYKYYEATYNYNDRWNYTEQSTSYNYSGAETLKSKKNYDHFHIKEETQSYNAQKGKLNEPELKEYDDISGANKSIAQFYSFLPELKVGFSESDSLQTTNKTIKNEKAYTQTTITDIDAKYDISVKEKVKKMTPLGVLDLYRILINMDSKKHIKSQMRYKDPKINNPDPSESEGNYVYDYEVFLLPIKPYLIVENNMKIMGMKTNYRMSKTNFKPTYKSIT